MMSRARRTVAAALALALTAAAAPAVTPVRTEAAGAFFEHRDASGCLLTQVDIAGLRERLGIVPEAMITTRAETFISRRDLCSGGAVLLRASESGAQAVVYAQQGLSGARLDGYVTILDFATGQHFVLEVQLAWEGTGASTTLRNDGPAQRYVRREAQARGVVRLNGENLAAAGSVSAALETIRTQAD